jgi:demethylmenaquinone methyltransferase/2-methoxy-6-polyprenyl-1,4-benzoquinol methylase
MAHSRLLGPSATPVIDSSHTSPRKQHAVALFAGLPRSYHIAGALMSFGQDPRWRRALVATIRPGPEDRVLDVATGTGLVAQTLVRAGGCRVVGLDQSAEMLSRARELAGRDRSLSERVSFVHGEAERLPFDDGEFDHVTFTYLLRYVDDPTAVLRELARVLRPGGRIACVEFGVPGRAVPRGLWRVYTRVGLPALGRLFSADWQAVGRFLGPSIEDLYRRHPLADQVRMWENAGLRSVAVRRMSLGAGVVVSATRDGGRAPD